ncbi:unnamed protein product [Prorocentrum cordatum]|uniref:Uncharacterized protein n=1 Tax=Prorocentrum cordatum TaxID=2364126 RepID=A0ABN9WVZ0_9DINO|nr:unnamed protein product [Polarella glacialis]
MESYGHGALGRVLCPLACPVQPSPTVQSRTLVAIFRDAALFSLPRISEVSAAPRVPRPYDFRAVEASGIEASAPLPGRRRAEGGEEEWYGMDGYGDMSKWYGMNGEVGENGWGREDGELGPYQSAHYGQHNQGWRPAWPRSAARRPPTRSTRGSRRMQLTATSGEPALLRLTARSGPRSRGPEPPLRSPRPREQSENRGLFFSDTSNTSKFSKGGPSCPAAPRPGAARPRLCLFFVVPGARAARAHKGGQCARSSRQASFKLARSICARAGCGRIFPREQLGRGGVGASRLENCFTQPHGIDHRPGLFTTFMGT